MRHTNPEKYCVQNVIYGSRTRQCRNRVKPEHVLCWKHREMRSEKDEELAGVLAVLKQILAPYLFDMVQEKLETREHRAARQVRAGS